MKTYTIFGKVRPIFAGILLALAITIAFFLVVSPTHAQSVDDVTSSGIATSVEITDKNVLEGDIVSFSDRGYHLSRSAYDSTVFGVVTDNPSVALENVTSTTAREIISLGKVYVRVTTKNGTIKTGDLITTSDIPGVGQKSDENGFVLGTAAESYSERDPKKIGKILVILNIGFNTRDTTASANLLRTLQLALSAPSIAPISALRYFLAIAIIIIAFSFALGFFGRISASGVEAIGRNPLAGKLILFSIILHILLALVVLAAGILLAYFILLI